MSNQYDVVIVGGGFTGLTAAYALTKQGKKVCVLEADTTPGGLAGTFEFADGVTLEKFYHHWFNNDVYVPELVKELGMEGDVMLLPTRTGMYFNGRQWKLSTPMDLLRFKALSLVDRVRLGLLVLQVRRIKDWKTIEHLSIREWLESLCGKKVYKIVWEPLINSKFSVYAEAVNAVWMWKKLVLRGGTRNDKGGEELAYFKGGFGRLAEALASAVRAQGGEVRYGAAVTGMQTTGKRIDALTTTQGDVAGNKFLFTPSFPIIANMFEGNAAPYVLGAAPQKQPVGNLLAERQRPGLSVRWRHRAHQLRHAGQLQRLAHRLPVALPCRGRPGLGLHRQGVLRLRAGAPQTHVPGHERIVGRRVRRLAVGIRPASHRTRLLQIRARPGNPV
jgi:protoporphyrinogen oxidase